MSTLIPIMSDDDVKWFFRWKIFSFENLKENDFQWKQWHRSEKVQKTTAGVHRDCEAIKNLMPIIDGKYMLLVRVGASENDGKCFVAKEIL